jgi:hypothetical protein
MSIKTALTEEIMDEVKELNKMQVGTEEYRHAVEGISKLADKAIELERLEQEHKDKVESRNLENDLKLMQMAEDRKDRRVKNGLTAAGIVLPLGATIWGVLKSLKFEETGSVSSIVGRDLIKKLLPRLK